jgi:dolichol-phosphate mannosyltransferase
LIRSLIIIPTFNEKENVENIIRTVLSKSERFSVLIVDDNSPDGTAAIVSELQTEITERLYLIERQGKLGLGTAYIAGFKWALRNGFDLIYEMDADFSHDPDDLLRLEKCCLEEGADVAIGSRYVKDGQLVDWPFNRWLLSFGASWYVRIVTGMPVRDPTAGFVCYKNEVLSALDLDGIKFIGYAFQIEMKFKSYLKGYTLKEIPITFKERELGTSKMSTKIMKEALFGVLRLRWDSMMNRI